MIVDSSALVALFREEPGHETLLAKLEASEGIGIGAPTLAETGMVLTARLQWEGFGPLRHFVDEFDVEVIHFHDGHWGAALDAFQRYGKGRHAARLNLGDCLTYAIARLADEPLLCVGDDFSKTDLAIA